MPHREIQSWLMDMDGVLVHEEHAIPGADRFLAALRERDRPFLVLTNNSIYTRRDLAARLRASGLEVPEEAIWTSALATARFLEDQRPGGSAFVIGEAGLTTALHEAGYTLTERDPDYVVLGETRTYSFERITQAIRLIVAGARFIATNPDATGPSPDGPLPATGSVAALISRATGVDPYYVGKPNPLMMRSALNAIDAHSETTAMIGDRMDTDVVVGPRGRAAHDPRAHRRHHARGGRALPVPPVADRRLGRRPRRRGAIVARVALTRRQLLAGGAAAAAGAAMGGCGGGDGQRRNDRGRDQCADRGPGGPVDVGGRPPRAAARPAHARVLRLPARPPPAPGARGDRASPRAARRRPRGLPALGREPGRPGRRGRALPRRRAATTSP